eukprot:1158904-Pelagomonas_calceolata.AAC.10
MLLTVVAPEMAYFLAELSALEPARAAMGMSHMKYDHMLLTVVAPSDGILLGGAYDHTLLKVATSDDGILLGGAVCLGGAKTGICNKSHHNEFHFQGPFHCAYNSTLLTAATCVQGCKDRVGDGQRARKSCDKPKLASKLG